LSEHFAALIPTTRVQSAFVDGDWEGVGVTPDIEVKAEDALKRARALVLERRMAKTGDAERRRELERQLEELRR
jgi:C-terminal processing protease CtpA/Prc